MILTELGQPTAVNSPVVVARSGRIALCTGWVRVIEQADRAAVA
ncbi:MAG: hypothetical protein WD096_02325 [Actinomycetota bacterium]